ncbi:unnamed protein product [Schistosoma mattheei]|uniref:Uncharacterized protein n=1 Tax=Schistosoma mattheei TaxID=31246 RepID=A0A3P8CQE7_9TREM|nr:unnamed protein product [Schistosoma mattheei]
MYIVSMYLVIQQDQSDPVVLQRRSYFDFLLAKTKYNQTQCHVLQILVLFLKLELFLPKLNVLKVVKNSFQSS